MTARTGFTLIELSIILVVIGLIIGGVLVGRDLIEGAMMRKVVQEAEQYSNAVYLFEEKYHCLPGDCTDAAQWGGVVGGNGDGRISHLWEHAYVWQHLSITGLVEGSWPGYGGPAVYSVNPGISHPASKLNSQAAWNIVSYDPALDTLGYQPWYDTTYGNNMSLGTESYNTHATGPVYTPQQMFAFDSKYDDGNVTTGDIMGNYLGLDALAGPCANIAYVEPACGILFIKNF